jgi:hypothetical protein
MLDSPERRKFDNGEEKKYFIPRDPPSGCKNLSDAYLIEYLKTYKSTPKHIICFGDGPNDIFRCHVGYERVDGGKLVFPVKLNNVTLIENEMNKHNEPNSYVPATYSNIVGNVYNYFCRDNDILNRYDFHCKSKK